MVLANSIFHKKKYFFENFLHFGHVPTKISVSPFLGRKKV